MRKTLLLVNILIAAASWCASAQDVPTRTVEVTKAYDLALPDAAKINTMPRIHVDTTRLLRNFTYTLRTVSPLSEGYLLNPIPPARVQRETAAAPETFQGYARLGLGFATSTLLDAYIGGNTSSNVVWTLYANHYGNYGKVKNENKEKVYNLNVLNDIGFNVRKDFEHNGIAVNAGFAPRFVHYYGYNVDTFQLADYDKLGNDSIAQRYLKTYVSVDFSGQINTWSYGINVAFDDFRAKKLAEDGVRARTFLQKKIDSSLTVGLALDVDFFAREGDWDNHTHFALTPYGVYRRDWWEASARLAFTEDYHGSKSHFMLLPTLNFTALFFDDVLLPYAEIKGELQDNTFESLASENPYLSPFAMPAFATTRNYAFGLGFKGRFRSTVSYNAWIDYTILKDAHFFVNTPESLGNYFNVAYDDGGRFATNAQLTAHLSRAFDAQIYYRYQNYNLKKLEHPLHQPQHLLEVAGRYNLWNKLTFAANLHLRGKYYALDRFKGDYISRPMGCDLSLNTEYRFFTGSSVLLQLNNLLGSRYQVFNGYNTYGFNVMLGYTFRF